ncbi:hypothetical protein SMAC4_10745 [Sordaria macrospora]|nr:hypothetical protein SMAC4_10745 [Sordaria macrospora]
MASPQDQPVPSVENSSLVLYHPGDFDTVMTNSDDAIPRSLVQVTNPPPWLITLHDQFAAAHAQVREMTLSVGHEHTRDLTALKEQYDILRKNYATVTTLFDAGIEASQAQIARWEQQVQQASSRFASEVWTAIAQYGEKDEERQKAVYHLRDALTKQQQAIQARHEKPTRQQSVLGHVETWATAKDAQINDILDKLEEQISTVQQSPQKAIQEAFERSGQQAPDAASIRRVLEQRAATKAPSSTHYSSVNDPPASPNLMSDSLLQTLQTRMQASQARMNYDATRADLYGSVRFGQSTGGQGPPEPPPPPPRNFGASPDDDARNQANHFLQNFTFPAIQTTPIHLNKPPTYDGKKLDSFRPWWARINAYLHAYTASFPTDSHKINWLGSMLSDKAQKWHDSRARQVQSMGVEDTWKGYSSALLERFKDPSERHRNAKKMEELKYNGDTAEYLTELLDLNETVGWAGTTFQNQIARTLPSKITELMYSMRGGVPETDDEFISAVREAGRVYENMLQAPGYQMGKGAPASRTEHSKSGQQPRKDSRSPSDPNQSSKRPDRSAKDKKWSSNRDALKGIDQADIDQRKKDQVPCWRCGRDSHYTTECFAKKDNNGKDLPQPKEQQPRTAAVSTKRKNDDREEEGAEALDDEAQFKKAKTAAITRAIQTMDMDQDSDADF